ncbi:endoglucanase 21-like [Mercurialis annua]|uniref:endoglucanase 21-like n=1 Tax=Mercurialis annua TaxID=3986 RepID=UPI0024AE89D3|nr:endoglucanase 21-like [Mercurialis annua]
MSSSSSGVNHNPVEYVHSISQAGRLLPSASQWKTNSNYDSLPSPYSKSFEYELLISDKKYFNRFLCISVTVVLLIVAIVLLVHFLPHKNQRHGRSKNLTLALSQALLFFDAQKSGNYPSNSPVKFRGDSGLQDGDSVPGGLVGGFYDSGNNIKFSFTTAYTITLLSWTVIEYHQKYSEIGELDHVKDIIRWGSDYLLQVFVPPNSSSDSITIYSQARYVYIQVGGDNDRNCWQRPEDMSYTRPVSSCNSTASDLAGEIVAALSAASIVFEEDNAYSKQLVETAEILFKASTKNDMDHGQGTYTSSETCGGQARMFYSSSGFKDELLWGGTWLFFATGNNSYLQYAMDHFRAAEEEETMSEKGIFSWNNKLTANLILMARILYFRDLGFPFGEGLGSSSNATNLLICSYLSQESFDRTSGGLILLNPDDHDGPIKFAATASFLSKLYSDYLELQLRSGIKCNSDDFSLEMLRNFARSQVNYILGDNPRKMSYMVGFGNHYPTHVHHRAASIPWDGRSYSCQEGERWLQSKDQNPNILYGAMVSGPDNFENFLNERDQPRFTQPSLASNAGLVAALVALHDSNVFSLGIDPNGIFQKIDSP